MFFKLTNFNYIISFKKSEEKKKRIDKKQMDDLKRERRINSMHIKKDDQNDFLPPLFNRKKRSESFKSNHNNEQLNDHYVPKVLQLPQLDFQSSVLGLNKIESRECKISPSLYFNQFEKELVRECREQYEKMLNTINDIRSKKKKQKFLLYDLILIVFFLYLPLPHPSPAPLSFSSAPLPPPFPFPFSF